ncbi:MAG TPA: DegT/DnrJ/EryC1/StrS family aminotransferase [Candidatus Dormibacteraeota bacterium]
MRVSTPAALALLGGAPAVPREARRVEWPVVTEADRDAVVEVLASGRFVSTSPSATEVDRLEQEWARFTGARHCVAVSSGTAALALGLAAAGVEPGAEVLVPALTFAATGLAALHQLAVPVFVDIDPRTFTIDAGAAAAAITERTRAIAPVHLHGLPADMGPLRELAAAHDLRVVEDAAQSHGAVYGRTQTGAIGDAGAFSLNVSKNLPTCGEGGLLTTSDEALYERALAMRQFGETIQPGAEREYRSACLGWNYKLSTIQAAFTRSQLRRFPAYQAAREANVRTFLDAVRDLPGLVAPGVPADRTHAWHMIRLRLDAAAAGLEGVRPAAFREAVRRALRAEGAAVSRYQSMPLCDQEVFRRREGFGRGYPWTIASAGAGAGDRFPRTREVLEDSLTIQRTHLSPAGAPLMARYAEAFQKVWSHLDVIAEMARSR